MNPKPWERIRVILSADLDTEAKALLVALAEHLNDEGRAWPSVATLADLASLSTRTVQRRLAEAVAAGWLTYTTRTGAVRVYSFVWAALPKRTPRQADAPVTQSPPTGSHPLPRQADAPSPVPESPPPDSVTGDPRLGVTRTYQEPTTNPIQPNTPEASATRIVRDVDDTGGAGDSDLNQDETDPHAHRPHRPTGNLATYTGPRATSPTTTRIAGRDVPTTWPGILGPSALRALPQEAAAIAALCTKLRTLGLTPAEVLATPADEWRFLSGIGGPRGQHVKLAELCRRAGWEPGCLAVAKDEAPVAKAPARKRRRTEIEVIDECGLTPIQQKAWAANDFKRDENDQPILLVRSVGGAS